jgi:hypothetical protein
MATRRPRRGCHLDQSMLPSPQVDSCRDVSDYETSTRCMERFADFHRMVAEGARTASASSSISS